MLVALFAVCVLSVVSFEQTNGFNNVYEDEGISPNSWFGSQQKYHCSLDMREFKEGGHLNRCVRIACWECVCVCVSERKK